MKKIVVLLLLVFGLYGSSYAQFSEFRNYDIPGNFTLSSDNTTLEIGGRVSAYYQYRFMKDGQTNLSHNGFNPKDIDLDILGKTSSKFVYEIQLSFLDLATAAATQNTDNPKSPGIKAAYVSYEGKKLPFNIKLGYDKVPYSQGSLCDEYTTPNWSHPILVSGDLFSRRDLGLTLSRSFWKKRVNFYGGVYSGLGENVFEYGNDASGNPEYIGRIDVAYPSRYKYDIIDDESSPVPVARLGVNARYTDKTQPAGRSLSSDVPDAIGPYGINIVNGKKTVYGGDFSIKYRGLSFTFETDFIDIKPADNADVLYEGTPLSFNKGIVHAGGFVTGLNYNWKQARSVFSANYEDVNANDLADGNQQWLYFAYAYTVQRFNSVFKVEYYRPLKEDVIANPLKYTAQLRIGYQIVF